MPFSDFKVLTFDVVGTLIDFETGILRAVRRIAGKTESELSDEAIFEPYLRGREIYYQRSSEVMALVYLHLAGELDLPASPAAAEAFQMSIYRWPAFRDSADALRRLRKRFRLVAMTNADRAAFSFYSHTLGNPFHDSVTADDTGLRQARPAVLRLQSRAAIGIRLQARGNSSRRPEPAPRHRRRQIARLHRRAGSSVGRARRVSAARQPLPN